MPENITKPKDLQQKLNDGHTVMIHTKEAVELMKMHNLVRSFMQQLLGLIDLEQLEDFDQRMNKNMIANLKKHSDIPEIQEALAAYDQSQKNLEM